MGRQSPYIVRGYEFSRRTGYLSGPLDLLLYLVRKHEVEIVDLPIAADHAAVFGVI